VAVSFLGWRHWAVDADGLLRPAWTPWSPYPPDLLVWRPDGVTEAHCLRQRADRGSDRILGADPPRAFDAGAAPNGAHRRVPDETCVCGLYAWRDAAQLSAARQPRWTRQPIVVGVARLGGRVIVADRGYRAERGYPVALLDPAGVVSGRYQVARYKTWPALTAEW
jgi:hypothetical protein